MINLKKSHKRFPEDAPSGPLDSAAHLRSTRAARSMPPGPRIRSQRSPETTRAASSMAVGPRIRSQRSARNDLICNESLLTTQEGAAVVSGLQHSTQMTARCRSFGVLSIPSFSLMRD